MKLTTLKKLERGAYALMLAVEKEMKTDSQAKQLQKEYAKQWSHWHDTWKAAAVAAARRKDNGGGENLDDCEVALARNFGIRHGILLLLGGGDVLASP